MRKSRVVTMAESNDPHAGLEVRCGGELTDDDGEPITNEYGNQMRCDRTLEWADHGTYTKHPPRDSGFEAGALRFECPDCGNVTFVCNICSNDDAAPGWFRTDSDGAPMPCHNCNQQEIEARIRHHGHAGRFGERRGHGRGY